jgi:hypothetical protein
LFWLKACTKCNLDAVNATSSVAAVPQQGQPSGGDPVGVAARLRLAEVAMRRACSQRVDLTMS